MVSLGGVEDRARARERRGIILENVTGRKVKLHFN